MLVALGAAVPPLLASLEGCGEVGPRPIAYGRDECSWCRMTVSDARYGAELVTTKGKQHIFDSIECLAEFQLALEQREGQTAARSWVTHYLQPGALVPAPDAHYLRTEGPGSPMGKGLMAFATAADADRQRRIAGGVTMSWVGVLAMVKGENGARG